VYDPDTDTEIPDAIVSVWYDHTLDPSVRRTPWTVSTEEAGGDERECYGGHRGPAAAAADARAVAASLLDRPNLRGLRQTAHPRGTVYLRPESEDDIIDERWPTPPRSVLVAL